MRITMGRIKPGSWPEFETVYRQHIGASPAAGLHARWLVRSTSDADTFFTVSLWDTLAAMETYERSDAVQRQILPHIVPYLNGVSTAPHCQVRGNLPLTLQELAVPFTHAAWRHRSTACLRNLRHHPLFETQHGGGLHRHLERSHFAL